jgi:hypothetical protein
MKWLFATVAVLVAGAFAIYTWKGHGSDATSEALRAKTYASELAAVEVCFGKGRCRGRSLTRLAPNLWRVRYSRWSQLDDACYILELDRFRLERDHVGGFTKTVCP